MEKLDVLLCARMVQDGLQAFSASPYQGRQTAGDSFGILRKCLQGRQSCLRSLAQASEGGRWRTWNRPDGTDRERDWYARRCSRLQSRGCQAVSGCCSSGTDDLPQEESSGPPSAVEGPLGFPGDRKTEESHLGRGIRNRCLWRRVLHGLLLCPICRAYGPIRAGHLSVARLCERGDEQSRTQARAISRCWSFGPSQGHLACCGPLFALPCSRPLRFGFHFMDAPVCIAR